mgnify:CR=1 FL=1
MERKHFMEEELVVVLKVHSNVAVRSGWLGC